MSHPLLNDFRFSHRQQVAWGDMDAFNHVNNVTYFRYMENARISYFSGMEIFEDLARENLTFVLGETRCRFRLPVTYPDTLLVGVRVSEMKEDRLVTQYTLVSEQTGKVAAEGEATVVCVTRDTGRKNSLPDFVRERIARRENPFC